MHPHRPSTRPIRRRRPARAVVPSSSPSSFPSTSRVHTRAIARSSTALATAVAVVFLAACGDDQVDMGEPVGRPPAAQADAPTTSPGTSTTLPSETSTTSPSETSTTSPSETSAEAERLLPRPTGEFAVGVRDLGALGGSWARVWYPATAGTGTPASYFTPPAAEAFGFVGVDLPGLVPWAELDAIPVPGNLPVVVLTSGWASPLSLSTSLAEQLASSGHLVIGLDPTPGTENPATPPDDAAAARRIADIRAAIDLVGEAVMGELAQDTAVVPVYVGGHSFGGAVAFEASFVDERIDGVFDLDGTLHRRAAVELAPVPALTVAGTAVAAQQEAVAVPGERFHVIEVTGAGHYDLTDAPLIAAVLGPLAEALDLGPAGVDVTRATTRLVDRFLTGITAEQPARSAAELTIGIAGARPVA